jgi:pimeloyl-ACP methyl ester carboxylesterase
VELRDGRVLTYAEYGEVTGRPVVFFHGLPGSRVEGALLESQARATGLRVIAPDRPGMAGSEFQGDRVLLDGPNDVAELADCLGVERFGVLGVSGGGPYVLACAHSIPDRVTAAVVVAGPAPMSSPEATSGMSAQSRRMFWIARRAPLLARVIFGLTALALRWFPGRVVGRVSSATPPCDRAVLDRPDVKQAILGSFRDAFRNGGDGVAYEMTLLTRPCGFQLKDVRRRVDLWQGTEDVNVPASMTQVLATQLPDSHAHVLQGEDHFSLPLTTNKKSSPRSPISGRAQRQRLNKDRPHPSAPLNRRPRSPRHTERE